MVEPGMMVLTVTCAPLVSSARLPGADGGKAGLDAGGGTPVDDDARALAGEDARDFEPDAAGGGGDEGEFVFELEIHGAAGCGKSREWANAPSGTVVRFCAMRERRGASDFPARPGRIAAVAFRLAERDGVTETAISFLSVILARRTSRRW
jgi:hypothetical protein